MCLVVGPKPPPTTFPPRATMLEGGKTPGSTYPPEGVGTPASLTPFSTSCPLFCRCRNPHKPSILVPGGTIAPQAPSYLPPPTPKTQGPWPWIVRHPVPGNEASQEDCRHETRRRVLRPPSGGCDPMWSAPAVPRQVDGTPPPMSVGSLSAAPPRPCFAGTSTQKARKDR